MIKQILLISIQVLIWKHHILEVCTVLFRSALYSINEHRTTDKQKKKKKGEELTAISFNVLQ